MIRNTFDWIKEVFSYNRFNRIPFFILLVLLIWVALYLPEMWVRAEHVDRVMNGKIARWDDRMYQAQAINLIHGYGYTAYPYLPENKYFLTVPLNSGVGYFTFKYPPGVSFMMSAAYRLLGEKTLSVRLMYATIIWFTAILLLLAGYFMAGWLGAVAGGLVGFYYMVHGGGVAGAEGFYNGRTISEPIAVFWISVFTLLFTLYLKKDRPLYLYLSAISLIGFVFARANFLTVIPLLYLFIYLARRNLKQLSIFIAITTIPIIAWSIYASMTAKHLIIFTTQGEQDFPLFNNMDVITGFGPEEINQGNWQPGFAYTKKGEIYIDGYNFAGPDENGLIKGLSFWINNPDKLPILFYVKIRSSFWYNDIQESIPYNDGRVYMFGVGLLLASLGVRIPARRFKLIDFISSSYVLIIQLALLCVLLIVGNNVPFKAILLIWGVIFTLAIIRPYGDIYQPSFQTPSWFLLFLISYLISIMLFGGYVRFHFPIDPPLMLISIIGLFTLVFELWKKDPWLSIFFLIITAYPLLIIFDFVIDWLLAKMLFLTTVDRSPITISGKTETHYHKKCEFEDATKIYLQKSLNYIWKRL